MTSANEYVPYHPETIRQGLLAVIRRIEPNLGGIEDCDTQDLLETLVDVVGVEHVDAVR